MTQFTILMLLLIVKRIIQFLDGLSKLKRIYNKNVDCISSLIEITILYHLNYIKNFCYSIITIRIVITNQTRWKHYQIYDIEIPKSLNEDIFDYCFVYQTKLFLFNGFQSMTQWNLSTMTFETQYLFNIFDYVLRSYPSNIVINTDQTLIALNIDDRVNIFSIGNGMWISRYG